MSLSVLIAGGGTGGHLYPGLAVARELLARRGDAEVTFVGTPAGLEARVIPREGLQLDLIRSAGSSWRCEPILDLKEVPAFATIDESCHFCTTFSVGCGFRLQRKALPPPSDNVVRSPRINVRPVGNARRRDAW